MTQRNPLHKLAALGQSVWLDYIQRGFIASGELQQLIEQDAVSGLTSNPAIFHKAMVEYVHYDEALTRLAREGLAAHEIYEALILEDIRRAADVLAPVYARTHGRDGFVSLEVTPHLAHDADGTYWEAKRLATLVDRENLMIKVPGTIEGVQAIRRLAADGLNINVTLLFSVERYDAVADAYMQGLEERLAAGRPIDRIASVASFFVSRIDTLIDERLENIAHAHSAALRGESAIAYARLAYRHFRRLTSRDRWLRLAERGAQLQRLLWASTGTKNPAYSDVKYVDALIGPDTVTTLPVKTLIAYRDHGDPQLRLHAGEEEDAHAPEDVIRRLTELGIDSAAIAAELEMQGVRKFIEPLESTLAALRERIADIRAA
ncbi:MAG: transaldolase [Steroidobacteraceae bacterium]|jgi:transaldolase|nr:transaldolase [Steroidobacteraceae bacterium]